MSDGLGLLKVFKMIGLALALGVSMSACSGSKSWKEEILLHDGSKIIIDRSDKLGGYPVIESRERETINETVTFTMPGSKKKISWQMDFRDSAPEPNSLDLLILDIVNGTPYIATYPAGCIAYNKWGRPNPPYIFFEYEGNEWKRIPLEAFPAELKRTNVIVGGPPAELFKSFYTAQQVNERNEGITTQEYKNIIRVPFPSVTGNCPVLVPIKGGGWESPGGSKAPGGPLPISPSKPNGEQKKN